MHWWQLSLNCGADDLDNVEALMLELGAQSLSLADAADEPLYEPLPGETPMWQASILTATFAPDCDIDAIEQQLRLALTPEQAAGLRRSRLADRDWQQEYRKHLGPIEVTPDLWIVPSWCEAPDPEATIIRLDPGLAFGTGGHPTTALCLAWLAASDLDGLTVMDYGCGSGVLSIAAARRGAARILGVDIDPQALSASDANLRINQIDPGRYQLFLPRDLPPDRCDLLMANILAAPLIDLAPEFAARVAPGGRILLSGILKTQLNEIQLAYRPHFELDPTQYREQWVSLSGIRKPG